MVAIVDYGVGNLYSLRSSLAAIGEQAVVTGDAAVLREADRILLPGVGAFGDAAEKLAACGLADTVISLAREGKPLLGICLGMQLLFDASEEFGLHRGLGLIPGCVRPIQGVIDPALKIPHIGWNALHFTQPSPLFDGTAEGSHVCFVHSFHAADCEPFVTATAEYSVPLTAAVQRGNVFGTQFHPEKSGPVGLGILAAFCRYREENK